MPNPLLKGLRPTHPGEILREDVLPALARTKTEIARLLGIPRQTLRGLLTENQPVTVAMALRVAKLTGTTAEPWLNLQRNYDLAMIGPELAGQLADIPTLQGV